MNKSESKSSSCEEGVGVTEGTNFVCAYKSVAAGGFSKGSRVRMDDEQVYVCVEPGEWRQEGDPEDGSGEEVMSGEDNICSYQSDDGSKNMRFSVGSVLRHQDGKLYVCRGKEVGWKLL